MRTSQMIASRIIKSLRSYTNVDHVDMLANLGDDNPRRARIALDILSKSVDRSKLVRVQRTVIRNGKSVVTHLWVLPSKVEKNDVILQNKGAYEQYLKDGGKDVNAGVHGKLTNNPMQKLKSSKVKTGSGAGKTGKSDQPNAKSSESAQSKQAPDKTGKPKAQSNDGTAQKAASGNVAEKKAGTAGKTNGAGEPRDKPKNTPTAASETNKGAGTQAKDEKKATEPDIFTNGTGDLFLTAEVYQTAKLDYSDNLASEASFHAAVNALQHIKKTKSDQSDAAIQKELEALVIQHMSALHGSDALNKSAEKYKGTESAKHYDPIVIACAASAWADGDHASIRARSLDHNSDADPVSNLYSKCLTDMVGHSAKIQSETLYRGIHVKPDFLCQALENGKITAKGLISTTSAETDARKLALKTGSGEVGVVLELPPSLKRKTFDLERETLLSMGVKFPTELVVKRVTKDADGIYHVQLMPKGSKPDGPVADDGIYAELGARKPGETNRELPDIEASQIDAAAYKRIMAYATGVSKDRYGKFEVQKALQQVYSKYGRDGAVAVLTEYARTAVKENKWTQRYESSETGYDPKLMEMVHDDWIHSAFRYIRKMEKSGLDEKSNGSDVYHKVCNDVLNSIVEKDGQEQPDMLYRGMKPYGESMQAYVEADVGTELTLGGIASFSATGSIANKFAGSGGIVLKIPKNAKIRCAYVAGLGDENEYVVPDAIFRVSKREEKWGRVYLTLAPT